jgi:molybdate transport system regulatory protein
MTFQTSARNQLSGTVSAIRKGAVNAEVDIALEGGESVVAQITIPSVESLALAVGEPVTALIKASWLILGTGEDVPRVSARNKLKGSVASVTKGAVNSEISLKLAGGDTVVASITNVSVEALGLRTGVTAWALFKASAVILAI